MQGLCLTRDQAHTRTQLVVYSYEENREQRAGKAKRMASFMHNVYYLCSRDLHFYYIYL
ncbi:MAG TPA: hypothetical protein PLA41_03005 [Candidatus Pacearchaeota archaeon]|nr:hypothetical protein [Candidatus Pacearchaeota archaeon]